MTLAQGEEGKTYLVEKLSTKIEVMKNKNGVTMIIKMRNTRLAIGRGISTHIEVRS